MKKNLYFLIQKKTRINFFLNWNQKQTFFYFQKKNQESGLKRLLSFWKLQTSHNSIWKINWNRSRKMKLEMKGNRKNFYFFEKKFFFSKSNAKMFWPVFPNFDKKKIFFISNFIEKKINHTVHASPVMHKKIKKVKKKLFCFFIVDFCFWRILNCNIFWWGCWFFTISTRFSIHFLQKKNFFKIKLLFKKKWYY